jgi:hypothetical protein
MFLVNALIDVRFRWMPATLLLDCSKQAPRQPSPKWSHMAGKMGNTLIAYAYAGTVAGLICRTRNHVSSDR